MMTIAKIISRRLDRSTNIDLAGMSLQDLIDRLLKIQADASGKFTGITMQTQRTCGCRSDCSCDHDIVFFGDRAETESEIKERLRLDSATLERKRKQYEELKKLFND